MIEINEQLATMAERAGIDVGAVIARYVMQHVDTTLGPQQGAAQQTEPAC